ncbi:sugar ABC transporter substrate-binding protein [Streptomyces sp. CA-210063]|uniref:sugar ABC transporter substrate-binding protein n=1 Tax=Streptomyces sp. CA-210063 TaxID=2801029 RepID=UPI00214BDCA0|nr:sugar ABC transporter substrate-binding protein [Streptomyces sp. CA-210063]UUU34714.1 sugar ABC transporter substrate-binding protein [Streptomyces sp. CA-210063]
MKMPRRDLGRSRVRRALLSGVAVAALLLSGCSGGGDSRAGEGDRTAGDTTCDGKIDGTAHITMWFHAGQSGELTTLRSQVKEFNKSQRQVRVELVTLPEQRPYTELVLSAAASGDLPDLLDFDGPNLYSYAWSGTLKPIDSCVPAKTRGDLLPSIRRQGTYDGRLWGVGTFDSGLGLYVRPSVLKEAGVRIPKGVDDAWTADELTEILRELRAAGYEAPLDLNITDSKLADEWNTYAFAPAVWSAGGDLIDPEEFRTADGFLNGPESVGALTTLQKWVEEGYVDKDRDKDKSAFVKGRSPISWMGHWKYGEFSEAHPGDVAIVPLPDFGTGTVTGMGSWQWGIPSGGADGDAVWRFLEYLLQPEQVVRMSEANGAIPATERAVKLSPLYDEDGAERLFIEQLRSGVARPRPQTPAYPAVTVAFSRAVADIVFAGAPAEKTLDEAVEAIDQDLAAHDGYPKSGP